MERHIAKGRVIDTFAARGLHASNSRKSIDSLGKYSLRKGSGLELQNRRPGAKRKVSI